jgi:hypothetical protein
MARTSPRADTKTEERIEAASLEERLDGLLDAVASEDVPRRLLESANALEEALSRRRQRRNRN